MENDKSKLRMTELAKKTKPTKAHVWPKVSPDTQDRWDKLGENTVGQETVDALNSLK